MTPDDCRAKADQYFQRVHDAQTSNERRVYLKLARAWLEAAFVDDDAPAVMPPAPRLRLNRATAVNRRRD
jgi:hypothetical protein